MAKFTENKILPYTPEQVFALVADVQAYPDFLPWCIGARVYNRKPSSFDADVIIGFKMFRETFTSRVTFLEPSKVDVDYIKGPMKRLYNHWRFIPEGEGACQVEFAVELEFKNHVLEQMIGRVFTEACERMVDAFEERAHELYSRRDTDD
ncbi:type II toxin-antitoxin system RatA family toxin [Kordiimonas aquimaris]|uniref:type II toxin-antitoxin system RatA family toxin n=1 Tax=Kordiimonas aquimaris TaxID=707591 RepID=UPI0021D12A5D|nr:type II toxin-antitoxin system RatA family toxin [Kordiimonas aquimaris]